MTDQHANENDIPKLTMQLAELPGWIELTVATLDDPDFNYSQREIANTLRSMLTTLAETPQHAANENDRLQHVEVLRDILQDYAVDESVGMRFSLERAALEAAIAALAAPEGWVLVPREATPEMLDAPNTIVQRYAANLIWQRMIAAAGVPTR